MTEEMSVATRYQSQPIMTENGEGEVRQLRANIYGECSDNNWWHCRRFTNELGQHGGWLQPENIEWLKDHQPKT